MFEDLITPPKVINSRSDVAKISTLYNLRKKYPKNVMISYININSIRNKLQNLKSLVAGKVDMLVVAESKLDNSFPDKQFLIAGYKKPYRLNVTERSGGLLIYVNENMPSIRLTKFSFKEGMQIVPVELNLRKQKWAIFSIYRPPKTQKLPVFLEELSRCIDFYYSLYENIMIVGDFNEEPQHPTMVSFMEKHGLYNHMKTKTCWKSPKGSCIDLILSNKKFSLQNTGAVETYLSDFHLLIHTMLKVTFTKVSSKHYKYRDYKDFDEINFRKSLESSLKSGISCYKDFEMIFTELLDKFAPQKTKILRANNKPHMSKALRKAMMKRTRLKNIAVKTKSLTAMEDYRKQRNLVVNLNRQCKKKFFNSTKELPGCKGFWDLYKPFFSDKGSSSNEKVLLVEKGKVIDEDHKIATIFNKYFTNITDSLDIMKWNPGYFYCTNDPILSAISKFENHPSVLAIQRRQPARGYFGFSDVCYADVFHEILNLDGTKKSSGDITVKVLKASARESAESLTNCLNECLRNCNFPDELKLAEVIPVYKKLDSTDKGNYRPISLLPVVSKVFEKLIYTQLNQFIKDKLSKFLCGFRKGYSTQYALFNLIQRWKNCLAKSDIIGAVLMDLSKAYDCLSPELLIAKLAAYGVGYHSLKFLYSYLTNRKQRVRIGFSVSEWLELLLGVPQGSILGPILFNIFINDLLFLDLESDICNFADDNTLSACDSTIGGVLAKINSDMPRVLRWFRRNEMMVNPDKFQTMFLGYQDKISLMIDGFNILSSDSVKLLGVIIDKKLTFNDHISQMCEKSEGKVKALLRIRKYIDLPKAELLANSFILSCFNYCPLIWMFCTKTAENMIINTHRRALRAVCMAFDKTYEELLILNNAESIHERNLRLLVTEVYKSINKLSPEFMWKFFPFKEVTYKLRRGTPIALPSSKIAGTNDLVHRACQAWNKLPKELKNDDSLETFKSDVKKIGGIYCAYKLCAE